MCRINDKLFKMERRFLGDTMMYDLTCKNEEPLRNVVMDFHWPKVSIFDLEKRHYSFSPHFESTKKETVFFTNKTDYGIWRTIVRHGLQL